VLHLLVGSGVIDQRRGDVLEFGGSPAVRTNADLLATPLQVVARNGIKPSTRGFSVRRRTRLGARKPKKRKALSPRRPNRSRRPSRLRTGVGDPESA
jgi:hypothetical protein